jgi:enterobacterial common antigen flippase
MTQRLIAIGVLQLVAMLALLLRSKALAVMLGPEAVGTLAIIDKLTAVITQGASFSLPYAALRFLPASLAEGRDSYISLARSMAFALGCLIAIAIAAAALVTLIDPGAWGAEFAPLRNLLLLALLTAPVAAFAPFIQNVIAAGGRPRLAMAFWVAHAIVLSISGVAAAWYGSLALVYGGYAVLGSTLAGLAIAILLRASPGAPYKALRPPPPQVWRFGGALLVIAIAAPYSALFTHYAVYSRYGSAAAGWMQAALGIALAVRGVLGSAHSVLLTPEINRPDDPGSRMRTADTFHVRWCLLSAMLIVPVLVAPDMLVEMLYASSFQPAAALVVWFLAGEMLALLAATYQGLVVAFGRTAFHVTQNLVAQALLVAVATLSIPKVGIVGAALGTLAAQAALYVNTLVMLHRWYGLRPGRQAVGATVALIAIAATAYFVSVEGSLLTSVMVAKVLVLEGLIAIVAFLLMRAEERASLMSFIRSPRP